MKLHEIKLNVNFADAVLSGEKSFEVRKNDRGYQRGDYIRFTATDWDTLSQSIEPCGHEIDEHIFRIEYVLNGWGLRDGYVAIAIRDVETLPIEEHEQVDADLERLLSMTEGLEE